MLWDNINVDGLMDECKKLIKQIKGLPKAVKLPVLLLCMQDLLAMQLLYINCTATAGTRL